MFTEDIKETDGLFCLLSRCENVGSQESLAREVLSTAENGLGTCCVSVMLYGFLIRKPAASLGVSRYRLKTYNCSGQ